MIGAWYHERILKHAQVHRRVTPPMWDPSAQGVLVDCDCGKGWAL